MEGWQKGAPAVLKFSSAGKQKYFKQFPEREAWFKQNYPEHFGRSVTAATTSLKKTNTAKKQQQRLSAIRQAASKRDQLKVSSAAVQAMGARRREGGEGLGGGLETNRDIIAHARAGGTISSGGLGSLFEDGTSNPLSGGVEAIIDKDGNTKGWKFNGVTYKSAKEANAAKNSLDDAINKAKMSDIGDTISSVGDKMGDLLRLGYDAIGTAAENKKKELQARGEWGLDWPTPDKDPTRWSSRPDALPMYNTWSGGTDKDILKALKADFSPKETADKAPIRSQYAKDISVDLAADRPDIPKRKKSDGDKGMYYEENELTDVAKTLAERIVTNKLQECMPEESKWDNLDAWEKNPIPKGASSEAEDEPGEYDYEGDMAKSQLRSIAYNAKMLHDMLEDNTNLPEWVQSKITLAEDYMLTAANYMRGEMDRMDEATSFPAGGGVINYDPKWEKSEAEGTANLGDEQPPFDPSPNRPEMDPGKHPEGFRRARQLARQALKAKIASMQQPAAAEDLVAQHNALHNVEEAYRGPTTTIDGQRYAGKLTADQIKAAKTRAANLAAEKIPYEARAAERVAKRSAQQATQKTASKAVLKNVIKGVAGKVAAPLAVGMAGYDAYKGFTADPNADISTKLSNTGKSVLSGLTFGMAGTDAKTIKAQAAKKGMKEEVDESNDLVNRGMLPDTSVIPAGKGFGDDLKKNKIINKAGKAIDDIKNSKVVDKIKKTKIVDKVGKAIEKKKPVTSTENPSENELVPQSMLPDNPAAAFPPGYVVPKPLEEQADDQNSYVKASATFLTKTSPRVVYGDKND